MESINVLPTKLKESIKSIILKEKFITYDVTVENLSSNGNNYGSLYDINIKGKIYKDNKPTDRNTDKEIDTTTDKKINIFAKCLISTQDIQIFSVTLVYNREMFVYNELMKIFDELQNDVDIPEKEKFGIVKSFDETNSDNIILDNLVKKGFKVYYRMDDMAFDYIVLAVKELAKLHGLSIALEKSRPEYFEENIKTINPPFYFNKNWDDTVSNMFQVSIKYLRDDVREKYVDKLWDIVQKYPGFMTDRSSICTLVHGDYKHNNIMVKEINGVPSKVLAVDYQIMHYGSPVLDFLYLIFNGTSQEFRRNHIDHLKDIYYDTLKAYLVYFNIDIQEILSRDLFEKLYKEKLYFGLAIQFFYIPFLFASESDVPDVTEDLAAISFKIDDRFGVRLNGIVDDFINWGYL